MKRRFLPYLLIAPLLLIELLAIILPSILNVGYAFTDWNGLGEPVFTGLDNLRTLVSDRVFWISIKHNVQWTIFFLTVPIAMALIGATIASRLGRRQMLFRIIFFVPYVVAPAVNAEIWRYILNPQTGIGAVLERNFGWEWANIAFFSNSDWVLWSIANVDNWHWWGFLLVLYLSAMQSIPPELFDAARVDGANRRQEFLHVILPGIRPTLVYTLVLSMTASFLIFDYVWILTEGGPAHASEVLGSFMYKQAFYRYNVGYASAIALGMTALAAAFSLTFPVLRKRGWDI